MVLEERAVRSLHKMQCKKKIEWWSPIELYNERQAMSTSGECSESENGTSAIGCIPGIISKTE